MLPTAKCSLAPPTKASNLCPSTSPTATRSRLRASRPWHEMCVDDDACHMHTYIDFESGLEPVRAGGIFGTFYLCLTLFKVKKSTGKSEDQPTTLSVPVSFRHISSYRPHPQSATLSLLTCLLAGMQLGGTQTIEHLDSLQGNKSPRLHHTNKRRA